MKYNTRKNILKCYLLSAMVFTTFVSIYYIFDMVTQVGNDVEN